MSTTTARIRRLATIKFGGRGRETTTVRRMAAVGHWWATYSPYQAVGTTQWDWDTVGEGDDYWSFSVRPKQANMEVEVVREWTTTDNRMNAVQHFEVRVAGYDRSDTGGLLMFNVIKVEGA